jgi:FG-GAP-like repeat
MKRLRFSILFLALLVLPLVSNAQPTHVIDPDYFYLSQEFAQVKDLDLDGDPDVIFAIDYPTNRILLWENHSDGTFERHEISTDSYVIRHFTVGDLDNDHDIDIIGTLQMSASPLLPVLWLEKRNNNWIPHLIYPHPYTVDGNYRQIGLHDIDMDDDVDIIMSIKYHRNNNNYNCLCLYENDGNQNFTPNILFNQQFHDGPVIEYFYFEDVDNDGDIDIPVSNLWEFGLLLNDGTLTFDYGNVREGWTGAQCWADYDSDGDVDVVMTTGAGGVYFECTSTNPLNHSLHNMDLGLSQVDPFAPFTLEDADVDLDGDPDLLISQLAWENPPLYLGSFDGINSFAINPVVENMFGKGLSPADMDGDGDTDAVTFLDVQTGGEEFQLVWVENELLQPSEIRIKLRPANPPVIIPVNGGSFALSAEVTNQSNQVFTGDAWAVITHPDGSEIETGSRSSSLPPGETLQTVLHPQIEAGWPVGKYQYSVRIGNYPDVIDEYSFPFWIE